MTHECKYFNLVNGELVCEQCGKPARKSDVEHEDKTLKAHEDKIHAPESKRRKRR